DLLGMPCELLVGGSAEEARATARELLAATLRGERLRREVRFQDTKGGVRTASLVAAPIIEAGDVVGALGVVRDVTEERRLAEQYMEREKLATVGRLVRGIAH